MNKGFRYIFAAILSAFALLTLFLSTSVIFDLFDIREKEGNFVLFVVWANFMSSLLYLLAAYGFVKAKKWTFSLLAISLCVLIAALVGLLVHANAGGLYETKTINAMIFRITVTLIFTLFAYFTILQKKQ